MVVLKVEKHLERCPKVRTVTKAVCSEEISIGWFFVAQGCDGMLGTDCTELTNQRSIHTCSQTYPSTHHLALASQTHTYIHRQWIASPHSSLLGNTDFVFAHIHSKVRNVVPPRRQFKPAGRVLHDVHVLGVVELELDIYPGLQRAGIGVALGCRPS